MLTQQQRDCIELLAVGGKTTQQIADETGISRTTLSKWKNHNEEFKAELDRCTRDFESNLISEANGVLKRVLGKSIDNIVYIANDKDEKSDTRLKANQYLIDRVLGNTTTKIEQEVNEKKTDAKVDIESTLKAIKEKNKVVKLPTEKAE